MTTETVDLQYASGRVLAQTLTAQTTQPYFDYSAMDGYAVNVDGISNALTPRLKLIGRITASRTKEEIALKAHSAVRIAAYLERISPILPKIRSRPRSQEPILITSARGIALHCVLAALWKQAPQNSRAGLS